MIERPERVADPAFPDLIGIVGGPLMPCKVVEIVETMAATTRVEGRDGLNATYEQTQRYVIRYQTAPVEITYMSGASDQEIEQARQAVVESVLEVVDEQQAPPGRLPLVVAGQDVADEYRFVLRQYRRARGLPVAGGFLTASEVNQAVDWWNKRQEVERG